jgi:16S rRNA processing protein RimM
MATGANDVLVVEGEKRHLVPYLPGRFVIDIDTKQRLITVDWDVDF